MIRTLRILLADPDPCARQILQKSLTALGHRLVSVVPTGKDLLDQYRTLKPELAFIDAQLPDALEAARQLSLTQALPIILTSARVDAALLEQAQKAGAQALLIKPLREEDVASAVALSVFRFEQLHALRLENASLRQSLEDRKLIERAKGVLMKRGGLDEAEAYRRLQRLASNRNQKAVEIAQMVLVAEEALLMGGA